MTADRPATEPPAPGTYRWTFPKDSVIFNNDGSVTVVAAPRAEGPAEALQLDEHGLPTSDERRRAAYVITALPHELKLAFIREVARQIGYEVKRRSRPSDERVPESEEQGQCNRFRHDEHCTHD